LDPSINVGILYSTASYVSSDAQCATIEASMTEYGAFCCHDLGIVSDEDDSSIESVEHEREDLPSFQLPRAKAPSTTPETEGAPHVIEFDLQGPEDGDLAPIDIDEEEQVGEPTSAAMLREYHCLVHLPFY